MSSEWNDSERLGITHTQRLGIVKCVHAIDLQCCGQARLGKEANIETMYKNTLASKF